MLRRLGGQHGDHAHGDRSLYDSLYIGLELGGGQPAGVVVPHRRRRAIEGFTRRYSQASGVSPGRHTLGSAFAGSRMLVVPQPLRAANDEAANGFAPRPFGPQKKLMAVCK